MLIDKPEFRERIYDLINGVMTLHEDSIPERKFVLNEFEPGCLCYMLYSDAMDAYTRLCERLGVEEWDDEDVEEIIDNLRAISRHIGLKMFEYGVFYARREEFLRMEKRIEMLSNQQGSAPSD